MSDTEDTAQQEQGTIIVEEQRLQEDYTMLPNTILRRADVTPGGKLTYTMLLCYARQKGSCFPGQDTLARDLGVSRRSVVTYLQELQKVGLLRVVRRGLGRTNVYTLTKWVQPRGANFAHQDVKPRSANSAHPEVQDLRTEQEEEEEDTEQHHGGVVGELTENGITRQVAQRLAESFEPDYLRAKIDLVRWLVEHHPKAVGKNAAGYLRRAIEEDYQPPADYKSPVERQVEADAKARRQAELDAMIARQQQQEDKRRAAEAKKKARALAAYRHEHPPTTIPGTELTTETAWQHTLQRLQDSMTAANYQTWLSETILVSCDGSTAIVVAPSTYVADWLRQRFTPLIRKELQQVLGFPVQLDYLALSEIAAEQADQATQGGHSAHST